MTLPRTFTLIRSQSELAGEIVDALDREIDRQYDEAPAFPRGVWGTPWTYLGSRWLFVVDHRSDVLHMEPLLTNGDRELQWRRLEALLEQRDPIGPVACPASFSFASPQPPALQPIS